MKTIQEIFKENKLVLAPLAKVHNRGFRLLCRKYGAGLVYTDMIVIPQIINNISSMRKFFEAAEKDFPIAVQLIGNENDEFKKAIDLLNSFKFFVDLNLGCPSYKFRNQEKGGFLLKKPDKIQKIIRIMMKYSENPISAKIRTGFNDDNENAVQIAKLLESEGVEFLCIHGKTIEQKYKQGVNYRLMKQIKESISIPIIGNGDIRDGFTAKKMLNETNCDAIMVGRASIGNPHVFYEITEYLNHENVINKDLKSTIEMIMDFWKLYKKYEGYELRLQELFALKQFTLHSLRGFQYSKNWRIAISKMKSTIEILNYVGNLS